MTPIVDPRFNISLRFKLTKSCTVNHDETEVWFTTELPELVDDLAYKGFYALFREVFYALLTDYPEEKREES